MSWVQRKRVGENDMVKLIVMLVFLFSSSVAYGQMMHGFTFTWGDPPERVDGTPIVPDLEIQSYRIRCEGAEIVERTVERSQATPTGEENQMTYEWVGAVQRGGWYDCAMTATDTDTLESDWSNVVRVRKLAQPMPPDLRDMR